ncbi:hypothetical protein NDU88_007448 [Pleurodeles waltl]|uniref:Uncharacterized protein n=1 Tax=Pleurodeles waltl TaxID=8319 RepID=A0AAV7U0E7_PLEWA|nr:hypothetical protein NDU88_007448 [Pleurodeles waltl]
MLQRGGGPGITGGGRQSIRGAVTVTHNRRLSAVGQGIRGEGSQRSCDTGTQPAVCGGAVTVTHNRRLSAVGQGIRGAGSQTQQKAVCCGTVHQRSRITEEL